MSYFDYKNIVLIGMPGVGKSTIGVLLAKFMSWNFVDTDVYIQAREGKTLQDIIDQEGLDAFCEIEEKYVISITCQRTIVATGGSVVYSDKAMDHFRSSGIIIHLYLPLHTLKKRLKNSMDRGIVRKPSQSLRQLFHERLPMYRQYADKTIDCSKKNHEEVIAEIISVLQDELE